MTPHASMCSVMRRVIFQLSGVDKKCACGEITGLGVKNIWLFNISCGVVFHVRHVLCRPDESWPTCNSSRLQATKSVEQLMWLNSNGQMNQQGDSFCGYWLQDILGLHRLCFLQEAERSKRDLSWRGFLRIAPEQASWKGGSMKSAPCEIDWLKTFEKGNREEDRLIPNV